MSDIDKVGLNLAIALGVPALVVILESLVMFAAQEISTYPRAPREKHYDKALAAGTPVIVGVSAVFGGLGADVAIAIARDDLEEFSPVIEESVILFSSLALIAGFLLAGFTAYLVIRLVLKELRGRIQLLELRAQNPPVRRYRALSDSQDMRLRLMILSLGLVAISIPASVTFLRL